MPLEAQRLGMESYASDLNPVAVLINKAMIEIPPKFEGRQPVGPIPIEEKKTRDGLEEWAGASGLAEDVRRYGRWMSDEALKRIGHLYPKIRITPEMVTERPDLKIYQGEELTIIAWLWAHTVKSPNPAFSDIEVPLVSTFMLSTKVGKEAYIKPVLENGGYSFVVKTGKPRNMNVAKGGTKLSRGANFNCLMSGSPITDSYIKAEGIAKQMSSQMMAIVAEGKRGKVYLSPTKKQKSIASSASPLWIPEIPLTGDPLSSWATSYGPTCHGDLYTNRQLVALDIFSDLVGEAIEKIYKDAVIAGFSDDHVPLRDDGIGALAYAEAVGVFLGMAVSRQANRSSRMSFWNTGRETVEQVFAKQVIPMKWDYCESNPFSGLTGSWFSQVKYPVNVLGKLPSRCSQGHAEQQDAQQQTITGSKVVSSDPPYYDNIGYADLSDFFYVWLRRSLRNIFPNVFATVAVPKTEELIASSYRHGDKNKADAFFLGGMTQALRRVAEQAHPAFPVTFYYAFKQSESRGDGITSTGWETFLDALIQSGFAITGTWPIQTELTTALKKKTAALASSIILVCRKRNEDLPFATRNEFLNTLKTELPYALVNLQHGNIAPVDLAQSAIGPGMAVFTRYKKVLDASGNSLKVGDALVLINQVLDESLAEKEGDIESDSRWALAWFEQYGFRESGYGEAEVLSKAKVTSVAGLVKAGIVASRDGKVRLLCPRDLSPEWAPETDSRLTIWKMTHHLIRRLDTGGEEAAAALVQKLGSKAETARELCYRLYLICDRKKRATEAMSYNTLVQSWPEIMRLARENKSWAGQGEISLEG